MRFVNLVLGSVLPFVSLAAQFSHGRRGEPLQDIVTWDKHSLMINGERLMVLSGEFHPFRLPSPGLWLDIFQKIRATGFNTVSFYVDWALVEGKQGDFSAEGVFALDDFYDAAKTAGIYLLARPGPYINAESAGGGLPGWIQRTRGHIRTNATDYETAAIGYIEKIAPLIARGQITNGGPVVMVQPENEYSTPETYLSKDYMQHIEDALRGGGVLVPTISDDGFNYGNFIPGSGEGEVDIYGHNSYPLGFDCSDTETWAGGPSQYFPTDFLDKHLQQSPNTPYAILEFEGGTLDHWDGSGFENCNKLLNNDFERVLYKHIYGFSVKIFNLYMMYGGTNWGNIGHSFGYTSYDYGAAIREDRMVTREKYSELKLQANFLTVSPQYLVATAYNTSNTTWTSTSKMSVTPLRTKSTSFWIVRHADFQSRDTDSYKLKLETSAGKLAIPQLGGELKLVGRDSKMLVTDYPVGDSDILYSTAEVFTWQNYGDKTVLVLFGGPEPMSEVAFKTRSKPKVLEGKLSKIKSNRHRTTLQWKTSPKRTVFELDDLIVYMMDRNSAYDIWVPYSDKTSRDGGPVIVKAGYLVRNATIKGDTLHLVGDNNATTSFELLGSPETVKHITWNGEKLSCSRSRLGNLVAKMGFSKPYLHLPDLANLMWKEVDSLPEITDSYNDRLWTDATNKETNNTTPKRSLMTPTSLYGSDYGYNTGALVYRGSFKANGKENTLLVRTQGGNGFASAVWLDSKFIDGWVGEDGEDDYAHNVTIGALPRGKEHVLTIVVDQNGFDESGPLGSDTMKNPRGVMDYMLSGHEQDEVTWKVTGNLHGEEYEDRVRGPLNEGGFFAERKGFHLPGAPSKCFKPGSPFKGIQQPGVRFYAASFDLDMPEGWDIPLSFVLPHITSKGAYRLQIYVNGWQFGKYASNLGPQTAFPVPEGILDYHGTNYVALTLFALEEGGGKLASFRLEATGVVDSGYGKIPLSPQGPWTKRKGSY